MSRQNRTHRPASDLDTERIVFPPLRPFQQGVSAASSYATARNAGHDFRRVNVFPANAAIQRKGEGGDGGMADVPVAAGGGEKIPDPVRAAMEGAFAQDFGDVRIHTGPEAKQVGALAYTRGEDLHFQPGRYDPFSHMGRSLLGHELTHVVQQRAGRVSAPQQNKAEGAAPINADAGLEAEADTQGVKAARGERATVSGAGAGVQRKGENAPIQRVTIDGPQNPNLYTQGGSESDVINLSALFGGGESQDEFRTRMGGEMAAQSKMLTDNDALPDNVNSAKPTIPNPKGYASFETKQRSEREKELDNLRQGKTNALAASSGEFTAEGAPDLVTPRPDAVHAALPDHKPVTDGATKGKSAFNGGTPGQQIKTLTGGAIGALEHSIQNPVSTATREREGLAARQQSIMATAAKADPFMEELENTGQLSQHVHTTKRPPKTKPQTIVSGAISPAVTGNVGDNVLKGGDEVFAFGAKEYGNRPVRGTSTTSPADYPERALPTLTNPDAADTPNITNALGGNVVHRGRYHEADVDAAKIKTLTGTGVQKNIGYEQRNAERLLYTGANSEAETPNYKGGVENKPVDHRFFVTNDHYQSTVGVTPLQKDYAKTNPYESPYMDKLAKNEVRPLTDSLTAHKKNELERMQQDTGEHAQKSSYNRDAEEKERVKVDGAVEDFDNDQAVKKAHEAALTGSKDREREEETRTQNDLKALAPSESVMAMYGMGQKGAEKMALQSLEQQHLGVQEFLKPGEAKGPTPMSDAASEMYG